MLNGARSRSNKIASFEQNIYLIHCSSLKRRKTSSRNSWN